jgi:hypothetical protein
VDLLLPRALRAALGVRVPYSFDRPRPCDRNPPPRPDPEALRREYRERGLDREADTFVLYRIIGNDLVPRHRKGQSRENVAWILENEPALAGCEKRWVLNRIVDPEEEAIIMGLLEARDQPYLRIPFEWDAYAVQPWDFDGLPWPGFMLSEEFRYLRKDVRERAIKRLYRHKNNYLINNNGARNAALEDGRGRAKWVLPWDGNCFITAAAWKEIVAGVKAAAWNKYFIVPMARIIDNTQLLDVEFRPEAREEPQVLFRRDAGELFDETYFYGRRPKVELFWRLGVPGKWDEWAMEPWDLPCPGYSPEAGQWGRAGWVVRLSSGKPALETGRLSENQRSQARVEAVAAMLDRLDELARGPMLRPERPVFLRDCQPALGASDGEDGSGIETEGNLLLRLRQAAEEVLSSGSYSVSHKMNLSLKRNPRAHWSLAAYCWPAPLQLPELPHARRDGLRVPGALDERLSERYDHPRVQRLLDDTFILSLAFVKLGDARYAGHAAKLVRRSFLDSETAITPHLHYRQAWWHRIRKTGRTSGTIDMQDLYYFLDAARLLRAAGVLSGEDQERLRAWLRKYLQWLLASPQGQQERVTSNHRGTYYDLQVATIAAFLGDYLLLRNTLRDSRLRIAQQFDFDGKPLQEMKQTNTAHYCCLNLQGWIHVAEQAGACGEDLWSFEGPQGQSLTKAIEWLLGHMGQEWPYQQVDAFDHERFYPIYYACRARYPLPRVAGAEAVPPVASIKPLFSPHDGIRPFWQLGGVPSPSGSECSKERESIEEFARLSDEPLATSRRAHPTKQLPIARPR